MTCRSNRSTTCMFRCSIRCQAVDFASLRGTPRLVTVFYASCPYMCPLIIDAARMSERALDAEERAKLSVLMVSFDARRDDPAALTALAAERGIDTARWRLTRTDAANVRKLAAVRGIQYRPLDDGEFSHTSVLILLDAEGPHCARSETMGRSPRLSPPSNVSQPESGASLIRFPSAPPVLALRRALATARCGHRFAGSGTCVSSPRSRSMGPRAKLKRGTIACPVFMSNINA